MVSVQERINASALKTLSALRGNKTAAVEETVVVFEETAVEWQRAQSGQSSRPAAREAKMKQHRTGQSLQTEEHHCQANWRHNYGHVTLYLVTEP